MQLLCVDLLALDNVENAELPVICKTAAVSQIHTASISVIND